jgi:hypothetical protein
MPPPCCAVLVHMAEEPLSKIIRTHSVWFEITCKKCTKCAAILRLPSLLKQLANATLIPLDQEKMSHGSNCISLWNMHKYCCEVQFYWQTRGQQHAPLPQQGGRVGARRHEKMKMSDFAIRCVTFVYHDIALGMPSPYPQPPIGGAHAEDVSTYKNSSINSNTSNIIILE